MAKVVFELSACTDCMFAIEAGDITDSMVEHIGLESGQSLHVDSGENDTEFSWSQCDCCGSRLGGSRHNIVCLGA